MTPKQRLKSQLEPLYQQLEQGHSAIELCRIRSQQLDAELLDLWHQANLHESGIQLLAVGGYGRKELYPFSDVDLLLLVEPQHDEQQLQPFLYALWDLGLEIGHSVRNIDECLEAAKEDISSATAMLEARTLAGDLDSATRVSEMAQKAWPQTDFFEAKREEQTRRHQRRGDTDHNLEPNVKAGPGGLRDLHSLIWIGQRLRGESTLADLSASGFLLDREFSLLTEAHEFLAASRFALHKVAGRGQNRLLFGLQDEVSQTLGFEGEHPKDRVEAFMKQYYRMVMRVNEFNEVLLQQMAESIFAPDEDSVFEINSRFVIRNGLLSVTHEDVFNHQPQALMELFALLADNPAITGITAETTRLVFRSRHLVDDAFRKDLRVVSHFMEILRRPQRLTDILRRMRLYGILSNYIPSFGDVMGLMQHDLFHIYTVDAHTLELVHHLASFWTGDMGDLYPMATETVQKIPKIEVLLMAGLYHDLGKGRGGDHSEIGAPEAEAFALEHRLTPYDARLVGWLVRHHLLMSTTAQRKDITDPEVILEFARTVGTADRLNYLFALTVADISATNPELWNAWRQSLLRQLFQNTHDMLVRGLEEEPPSLAEMIDSAKDSVAGRMGIERGEIDSRTLNFGATYFAQHSVDEITWHLETLDPTGGIPQVLLRNDPRGTQVFVMAVDKVRLFSGLCRAMERGQLNVVDARVCTSLDGRALDSFVLVDSNDGLAVVDEARLLTLKQDLLEACAAPRDVKLADCSQVARVKRHFSAPTKIRFTNDESRRRTVLELITPDRPGLLAKVAGVFDHHDVDLRLAKIATLGERVEDYFYLVDSQGLAIDDDAQLAELKQAIINELDEHEPQS